MQNFVNITTHFKESRSVETLSQLYKDTDRLKDAIRSTLGQNLTRSMIEGKKVFLKPNWVNHSRRPSDEICLRTHDNFLLAFTEIICELRPRSVVIGDAPIQGCKWEEMIDDSLIKKVDAIATMRETPIAIKDLRRVVFNAHQNQLQTEKRSLNDFVIFDLGERSYLEPITEVNKNKFRVTHYDPDRFVVSHKKGMHKYCITRELFEADVVISLPKVKTHEKSGITAALKNIVGLNGDKDFLPHHRIGGTGMGGDAYPGRNIFRYAAELCYDQANRVRGKRAYFFWVRVAARIWRMTMPNAMTRFGAGWHGNDTTWRMVMDLNLIAIYGKADGTIAETPVRQLYSLCDGIVGGQGDGPLRPDPLNLGVIAFTNDSGYCDAALALMMGININRLPLLNAARAMRSEKSVEIRLDNNKASLQDMSQYAVSARMPSGWLNYNQDE
jgi:uncharacterized protein (DUF362 family)